MNFFNLSFSKEITKKNLRIHLILSSIWLIFFLIFILRIDVFLLDRFGPSFSWLRAVIPIAYFILVYLLMRKLKWYYYLILFAYPVLQALWFIPKIILIRGKIYLFGNYIRILYHSIKHYKRTLILIGLLFLSILLLALTPIQAVRIGSLLLYTYLYLRMFRTFLKDSFNPPTLFSDDKSHQTMQKFLINEQAKSPVIDWIEKYKDDEKLNDEQNRLRKLKYIAVLNYTLEYLKTNLDSYKGKLAFFIAMTVQIIFFFLFTMIFFFAANYLLFKIDPSNYVVTYTPARFDFFYYTLKAMVNSSIDPIKPRSPISKILEIGSFYSWGIFCLIAIPSFLIQLRREKIKEKLDLASKACEVQTQLITTYLKDRFNKTPEQLANETDDIQLSINNVRNILSNIL